MNIENNVNNEPQYGQPTNNNEPQYGQPINNNESQYGQPINNNEPQYGQPINNNEPQYAGFWLRFIALIIDGMIIFGMFFCIGYIMGIIGLPNLLTENDNFGDAIGIIIIWLYFAIMESSPRQATFGKTALRLKVTDINLNNLSFAKASLRHFGKIISTITIFIGYIIAGFSNKKQALHDIIAGTLVIKS